MGALQVRHEAASAALVRRRISEELTALCISGDAIDAVVLVTSELIGNAVLHAAPSPTGILDVNWDVDDHRAVTVCVGDHSPQLPKARKAAMDEPGGRGLAIIEALALDWGVDFNPGGKLVWARIPIYAIAN